MILRLNPSLISCRQNVGVQKCTHASSVKGGRGCRWQHAYSMLSVHVPTHAGSVRANCAQRIAKVFDQYLSFIALESRLFSLGLPDTYLLLNDPKAQDTQVQVGNLHFGVLS